MDNYPKGKWCRYHKNGLYLYPEGYYDGYGNVKYDVRINDYETNSFAEF